MSTRNGSLHWISSLWLCPEVIAAASLLFLVATAAGTPAQAQNFTVLYTFTGTPDGAVPFAGLLRDTAGNLSGTTLGGGCLNVGTVFKIDPAGNETVPHCFTGPDGTDPFAGLVMDAAGNLYGTTRDGGTLGLGTVFKLDTSNNLFVLHTFAGMTFSDGAEPYAGLVLDAAGNLYGTTSAGGASSNCSAGGCGTVFKLDTSGNNYTVLHSFTGSDGATPLAGLIRDAVGNLYGTTSEGGTGACPDLAGFLAPCGTVFKLDTSNNLTTLYSFKRGSDGGNPIAGLLMDVAGNLYGTTVSGGSGTSGACSSENALPGCGTVFKLDTSLNETIPYSFKGGSDGALPYAGLVMDAAGNLYGTTSEGGPGPCTGKFQVVVGCGTIFKLDPSGNETVLYSFTGGGDGAFPLYGYLATDTASDFYGTASRGGFGAAGPCAVVGGVGGCGTVFKLAVQAPVPTIAGISPTSAIAGGPAFTLTVNGTNFISSSTVNFNGSGVATTFVSSTQLVAAIPASDITTAGTFNVTVTNPGSGTSNAVSFTVVTPQQATQAIMNSVNVLLSQGVLNGGQDNSLVKQLQQAINLMNAGKNAGAIGSLDCFISEMNDLLSSGVLSPSQAVSLVSAAESVTARLS